ncbi:MAG: fasciclin domain-containing protein, partial [Polaromonas sp.]|nr:fasciclin domain-containing protein [Polaromonas sp.]
MSTPRFLVLAAAVAALAGCATSSTPVSVTDTIAGQSQLSTLNGLVTKAGLGDTLKSGGPYTVFAP